ncbi:MAG: sigma-70 family RNA polymerase sigma factor [Planctomycetota bacterium]
MTTAPAPASFNDAITRRDVLGTTGDDTPLGLSKFRYYEAPIRRFIRAVGAPREDIDDLVQEALLLLHTRVLPNYDPAHGPFRPYLKQALRNLVIEHLRRLQREKLPQGEELLRKIEEADAAPDKLDAFDESVLTERLRAVFDRYMREAVPEDEQIEAEVLAARLAGESQTEVAARIGKTDRWVRVLQERAAERFWSWAREQFHPDDWKRVVPADLADVTTGSLLVRWLSRRKRRELAAVLVSLFATKLQ